MKKLAFTAFTASLAFFFAACDDSVDSASQVGMEIVSSEDDLPKCTKDNKGEQVFVEDEMSARVCIDGDWVSAAGGKDTVYLESELSCKTVELKDGSGLKIVCNGDSIGVVLNGKDTSHPQPSPLPSNAVRSAWFPVRAEPQRDLP